jgi:hypothetical protein
LIPINKEKTGLELGRVAVKTAGMAELAAGRISGLAEAPGGHEYTMVVKTI